MIFVNDFFAEYELVGWQLQFRYKPNNGEFIRWQDYWNHKLYNSEKSAMEAANNSCFKNGYKDAEFRCRPLYSKIINP